MSLTRRIFRERQRIVLPVLGFLAANIAVLAFVVWPMQREVDNADATRQDAQTRLTLARQAESAARSLHTSGQRAESELKSFYSEVLPADFNRATNLTTFWLKNVADRSGIRFKAGAWEPKPIRDSQLVKVTGSVTLLGEYNNVQKFLYEIETAEQFIIIEDVALSQPNADGAGPVELALTVTTFFKSAQPQVASK